MEYVIIGGSAAGISAVEGIRNIDKKSKITLISEEDFPLYSRCLLSYLLAGVIDEGNIYYKPRDFYKAHNVDAKLGIRVERIDRKKKEVVTKDGKRIKFDRLLIATGARAKGLNIKGVEKKGVFCFRTIEDERGIEERLGSTRTALVLGGGLIGLRAAYGLHQRGVIVKVIIRSNQVLSQVLDKQAADIIQEVIETKGIEVLTGLSAKEVLGDDEVVGIELDDKSRFDCQMVIIGKGVRPNIELGQEIGLKTNQGILVSEFLQTSYPDIYAAGDVAETEDITQGKTALNSLWPNAVEQGKIAGMNMAGQDVKYEGAIAMNSVDFFGIPVISMGITKPKTEEGLEQISFLKKSAGTYKKVVIKDGIICGFIGVGKIKNAGIYNLLIRHRIDVSKVKDVILNENFDYAKAMPLIKERPDIFDKKDEFRDFLMTY